MDPKVLEEYKGKQVLVTGGAGFIASSLIRLLIPIACRIIRLDRPGTAWTPCTGAARVRDVEGDVRDSTLWEEIIPEVDIVFHFAAQTSAYAANADPASDITLNVIPMIHLLETCRKLGSPRTVVFSSTSTIVGIPTSLPVGENHPDHPITIYDLHKLMAERYLKYYADQQAVRAVALRLVNIFGPGPPSSSSDRGILNLMTRRAIGGKSLTVYGSGDQLRDYLYVEDAAIAFLTAAALIETLSRPYYIIGTGVGHSIAQAMRIISDRVAERTGKRVEVEHIPPPTPQSPIEGRNFIADSRQFRTETGWEPRWTFIQGIDQTIEVFL